MGAGLTSFLSGVTSKRKFSGKRTLLVSAIGFFLVYYTLMFSAQRWLLYPADLAPPASAKTPPGIEKIVHEIDSGEVYAWFSQAPGSSAETPAPLVIFFHGNAEVVNQHGDIRDMYTRQGMSVLMPEYRGYGRCDGKPAQSQLLDDHCSFYDRIVSREDVDDSRVIFHGRSLGGGIAADLATKRECQGLILESTFQSIPSMARRFLVPGFLVLDRYQTDEVVSAMDEPVLIMHGKADRTIPVSQAQSLSRLVKNGKYVEFEGVGHNNLPAVQQQDQYDEAIRWLLEQAGVKKVASEVSPSAG